MWSVIVVEILNIIFGACMYVIGNSIANSFGHAAFDGFVGIVVELYLVSLVLGLVYTIKLSKVKADIVKWTHIVFGFNVVIACMAMVSQLLAHQVVFGWIIGLVVLVLFWWLFCVHLTKAIAEGRIKLQ